MPLPRATSSSVMPSAATRASSLAGQASTSSTLPGAQPAYTPNRPAVGVLAGVRVDRVRQAALLPDLLEQPAGHAAAEHVVEHAEREPALVEPADARRRRAPGAPARCPCLHRDRPRRCAPRRASPAGRGAGAAGGRASSGVPRERLPRPAATTAAWSRLPAAAITIVGARVAAPVEAVDLLAGSSARWSPRCRRSAGPAGGRRTAPRRRGRAPRRRARRRAWRSLRGSRRARSPRRPRSSTESATRSHMTSIASGRSASSTRA